MNNIHFPQFITPIILILLLSSQPTRAQPSGPGNNLGPDGGRFSPSMGVIIIVLVAALFFMGFFSIYIRHCSDNPSTVGVPGRGIGSVLRRSRRAPRGLDAEVIESFPTFDYVSVKNAKIGKGALECAVCLTEFEDEDTLRLIPKCDHVFHPDCIDAWLIGHTTCPVCRCNLADDTPIISIEESNHVVVEVDELRSENYNNNDNNNNNNNNENEESTDSMEQPLHGWTMSRSRTMRNVSFGRPRWLGKLTRSLTTGHVAVKQWENMERFTLRLPDEVRKQIMSGKLVRTTSLVVLPRETSSRRGYRTGFGEGSSRGRSDRPDRASRSDRWVFSLAPPFFTRVPSIKSPKVVDNMNTSRAGSLRGGSIRENVTSITSSTSREGSLRGAMQAELTHLPV
ncbi:E3 ubiquitin-protein ligase ATL6 [Beta vulgaris subsp. vulgaris]|uniref:E3 ubiquitin-protein ligase ATL6 n=1 Tax=Beta vulgaris subsp. vulgaris TaxID=3555 RepID=UPI002036E3A5|nr:E3 ubiquitin-protein ligase ATL6 [Beta vulgaris subsp. vulgaris]